jgi:diguanylate cyclase (GGDEF)-like protein
VGKLLRCAVRSVDLAARYGGEEFVLVLTETESSQAAKLAEQIRQALAAEKVAFDGQVLSVTCSIGVAGSDRTRVFQTAAQLCDAADRAAYAAKQAGRNSVRIFRPRPQAEPAPSGAAG